MDFKYATLGLWVSGFGLWTEEYNLKQFWHLSSGHSGCSEQHHNWSHLVANFGTSGTFEM